MTESNEQSMAESNKQGCFKTCYQKTLIEHCNCSDVYLPRFGRAFNYKEVPVCSVTNEEQDLCKHGIQQKYIYGKLDCLYECTNLCEEEYYETQISTSMWPSERHKDGIVKTLAPKIYHLTLSNDTEVYHKNLLQVEIYFNDFNLKQLIEYPAYNDQLFASDIGGVLGLWLGFSILTICELIEFVADMCVLFAFGLFSSPNKSSTKRGSMNESGKPKVEFEKLQETSVTNGTSKSAKLGKQKPGNTTVTYHNQQNGGVFYTYAFEKTLDKPRAGFPPKKKVSDEAVRISKIKLLSESESVKDSDSEGSSIRSGVSGTKKVTVSPKW